jgi:3-oxoacyl-[acyl-carrier-protein] synthase III
MSNRSAHIISTGRYIPEKVVTNADLSALLGSNVGDWLVENVGIRERHVMRDDETTSGMVIASARQAIERAGITAADLDLIIVATDTPDYISPATSSVVQAKLEAAKAGTMDVNCACAGWVTALDVAARYIATEPEMKYVLVAGAYGMTKYVDWTDKYTCTLFADGAACAILGAGEAPGFLAGSLAAEGIYHDALGIYTGGTFRPATPEQVLTSGKPKVEFVRKFPATFNSDNWPVLIRKTLSKTGLTVDDVSFFVFTQLNVRTIEFVMQNLGQPMSKTHTIMDKWGYIGSACIPAALDDALECGKGPRNGDIVVFCATGGGMAMAVNVWKWIS